MAFSNDSRLALMGLILAGIGLFAGSAATASPAAGTASTDTSMTMEGGSDGTVFRSLTVEAENRVQISFARPELLIDLDPATAPGLSWGSARDVLDRTAPDLVGPYLRDSARWVSPYTARPWIVAYRTGPVVVIRLDLKDVDRWRLTVVDSRGREVHSREGKKNPPKEIPWDGLMPDGTPVLPGLTYSFVLEAMDKAGNKRRFVGDPFEVAAYRITGDQGTEFMITGQDWRRTPAGSSGERSAFLLETAGWFNLTSGPDDPIVVQATARSASEAEVLGRQAIADLQPLLPGDAARLALTTQVEAGAPPGGALRIRSGGLVRD